MKLNHQDKNELRNCIETILSDVEIGNRIHIEKEVLEELLFDTIVYNKKEKKTLKLPVWSGYFLKKIDLSEVSFDNVSWNVLSGLSEDQDEKELNSFDNDVRDKYHIDNIDHFTVFYVNTNAKIDFTESWEYKNFQEIKIGYCSFSDTDLSFNDMSHFVCAIHCDLDNTGLKIVDNESFKIYGSTLDGLDLSGFTIDASDFFNDKAILDSYCTFRNTRLHITNLSRDVGNSILTDFKQMRKDGYFDGCFINEHYILSKEKKEDLAFRKRKEYEKYKALLMDNILKDIKDQVAILEKKKK